MKCFTIFDSKIQAYTTPFFATNEMVAIRSFERAAMNPDQTMHTHPADFTLFEIAEWDEQSGKLVAADISKSIINGIHLPFWQTKETE